MTSTTGPVWMTAAALEAFEAELAELSARPADDAEAARIFELRDLIRRAELGEKPDDGLVEPGMIVAVRFEDGSTERFLLGSRELVGHDAHIEVEVYSPESPLGSAIVGRYVGDAVRYVTPSGAALDVTVLEAVPFG